MRATNFISILSSMIKFAYALKANVVTLPCDVVLTERLNIPNMSPAKITPENFSHLCLTLQICGIEKAQVSGYMGFIGPMVLYANGTCVPAEKLTLPKFGLFIEDCKCTYKVICGYSTDGFRTCKFFEPTTTILGKTQCVMDIPDNSCIPQQPACTGCPPAPTNNSTPKYYCPPMVRPPVQCALPCPIINNLPCNTTSPCNNPCKQQDCPYYISIRKVCESTPTGKKYSEIKSVKTYVFDKNFSKNGRFVKVFAMNNASSQEVIDLKKTPEKETPKAIYEPKMLYMMRESISRQYGECVCLYISKCSVIYAYVGNYLYRVEAKKKLKKNHFALKRVSSDHLSKIIKDGLYGVEFESVQ